MAGGAVSSRRGLSSIFFSWESWLWSIWEVGDMRTVVGDVMLLLTVGGETMLFLTVGGDTMLLRELEEGSVL